ncbi:MAG TPA: hypothetical protein VHZ74_01160 [Bryobacteraceae bacterium]|nr:hypothetical protein [Bryobacteraceae bacterium]
MPEPQVSPDLPPSEPPDADLAMLYCPVCSLKLESRKCKLFCPQCGYYMSCADYY